MKLESVEFSDILVKIAKKKCLEENVERHLYFNDIEYLINLETTDNSFAGYSRENKQTIEVFLL